MRFMGEGLGLVIVLLSSQICLHLNVVGELLVDSKLQIFLQKILKSVGASSLWPLLCSTSFRDCRRATPLSRLPYAF